MNYLLWITYPDARGAGFASHPGAITITIKLKEAYRYSLRDAMTLRGEQEAAGNKATILGEIE